MTTYFRLLRLFYKSAVLIVFTILFFILSIGFLSYSYLTSTSGNGVEYHFLAHTLVLSLFAFLFFLFVSYEFFYKMKQASLEETLRSMRNGLASFLLQGFAVLLSILLPYFAILLLINLFVFQGFEREYVLHVIQNLLCNLLLVPFAGVVVGAGIATMQKRVSSCAVLLLCCLLVSPLPDTLAVILFESSHVSVFPLLYFFRLHIQDLDWDIPHFGYSLLQYRWQLPTFWILGMLLYLLCYSLKSNRRRMKYASLAVLGAACGLSLICYLQPTSRVLLGSYDPVNGGIADQNYYTWHKQREEAADFRVTDYRMDISFHRLLKAKVQVTLDKPSLPEYRFTLFHSYRVKSVQNSAGEKLAFTQEGDYLTVQNPNGRDCGVLTLSYSGSAARFYSNAQGAALPGYFPYYPHSGFSPVFDTKLYGVERFFLSKETSFHITVDSPRKVYCNLPAEGTNVFAGKSNGVTLLSGFLKEQTADGVKVVYPYLDQEYAGDSIASSYIPTAFADGVLDDSVQTILVLPHINLVTAYERTAKFSDHMSISQFPGLTRMYQEQRINSKKLLLDHVVSTYREFPDMFQTFLESEKGLSDPLEDSYYAAINDKIKQYGADFVMKKCESYVKDDTDTRSISDFLSQLGEEE